MSNIINNLNIPENISLVLFNNTPNGKNINHKCGAVYPEYLQILLENLIQKKRHKILILGFVLMEMVIGPF